MCSSLCSASWYLFHALSDVILPRRHPSRSGRLAYEVAGGRETSYSNVGKERRKTSKGVSVSCWWMQSSAGAALEPHRCRRIDRKSHSWRTGHALEILIMYEGKTPGLGHISIEERSTRSSGIPWESIGYSTSDWPKCSFSRTSSSFIKR